MKVLNQNIRCVNEINLISAPKSCPYVNYNIEIIYTNNERQYLTHKNDNPNDLNFDFESHEELINYYDQLKTQLK